MGFVSIVFKQSWHWGYSKKLNSFLKQSILTYIKKVIWQIENGTTGYVVLVAGVFNVFTRLGMTNGPYCITQTGAENL